MDKITVSVIKADIGGFVGHSAIHSLLIEEANNQLSAVQVEESIIDYHVTACGDDLELVMTHHMGVDHQDIDRVAWSIFEACTEVARKIKLPRK